MNQICKVCGEPAAGFHFGAFTCEGCKSFFGRSYNNINSISDCKNNGECIINKKNRTSCKSCRLKKCLMVGMSKSGSRYGRRSNWFKIHCLLQEQHNQNQQSTPSSVSTLPNGLRPTHRTPPPPNAQIPLNFHLMPHLLHLPRTREEMMVLGMDEHMNSASPSVSSPESHNSDSSVELNDMRRMPFLPGLLPPHLLHHPGFLLSPGYPPLYPGLIHPAPNNNNNNRLLPNQNHDSPAAIEAYKRVYLEAMLQRQRTSRTPTPEAVQTPTPVVSPAQEIPIDLSMRGTSERGSSPTDSEPSTFRSLTTEREAGSEADEELSDCESETERRTVKSTPLDLTTKQ